MSATTIPSSAPATKYWAFISYSHQDNLRVRGDGGGDHIAWANWLHEQLETYRVWTVLLPSAGAPPKWFASFLRYLAQRRFDTDGELMAIPTADLDELREKLRAVLRAEEGKTSPYLEVLRRFVREELGK